MPLRGTYTQLLRRADELERLVARVAPISPGCPTCAGWPDYAVTAPADDDGWFLAEPWYCQAWARPHRDACPGCVECRPRQGWPEGFRCPDCGREPAQVIQIAWADRPGAAAHAPDRQGVYARYGEAEAD